MRRARLRAGDESHGDLAVLRAGFAGFDRAERRGERDHRAVLHSRAGRFKLKRKTSSKKLRNKFADLKEWLRHNLTQPIDEVWKTLNSKLRGHYQYYGINDNWPSLIKYQETAKRFAYRWICRRSQKGRISLREYGEYLKRNPLAGPIRLTDLIAKGRALAAAMQAVDR